MDQLASWSGDPNERGAAPRTLAEAVYRRMREDIMWGKLKPGAPLRSDELRKTYEVGISPLREALSRLLSDQLVTSIGQRGFRVATIDRESVLDTLETRLVVETTALTKAIEKGDIEWEAAILGRYHALSRLDVPGGAGEGAEQWAKQHREFHTALLSGCGSPWLMNLAAALYNHSERHRILLMSDLVPEGPRDPSSEHRVIMDAALARDAEAACAALGVHLRTTANQVVAALADLK
jgi:GntR family carbon starvation induced transcriptional regulator